MQMQMQMHYKVRLDLIFSFPENKLNDLLVFPVLK